MRGKSLSVQGGGINRRKDGSGMGAQWFEKTGSMRIEIPQPWSKNAACPSHTARQPD